MTGGTIFAVASGAGRSGVAVVRVSGPDAGRTIVDLTGKPLPQPRFSAYSIFRDPIDGTVIDSGLCLWFPAPASFTGEDVAELHIHGGPACTAAMLSQLSKLSGLRPAEPGEFTRRAFENGKLDLTAAEGLADLVNAETDAQRIQALRQRGGELARLYDGWRRALIAISARVEAYIDFPEEDLPPGENAAADGRLKALRDDMSGHLDDAHRGERLRDGYRIALIGPPNSGKSTLLNLLARRDVAIVSETAGTTRDVIEVHLDLAGFPVTIADTAGIRATDDAVEREGVRRSHITAAGADFRIAVLDAVDPAASAGLPAEMMRMADLVLINKTDIAPSVDGLPADDRYRAISAKTGTGLEALLDEIRRRVAEALTPGTAPSLTRARHRASVAEAVASLDRALEATAPELRAEDLRLASRALGRITGHVDVEDLLDVVFRDFCIGK